MSFRRNTPGSGEPGREVPLTGSSSAWPAHRDTGRGRSCRVEAGGVGRGQRQGPQGQWVLRSGAGELGAILTFRWVGGPSCDL